MEPRPILAVHVSCQQVTVAPRHYGILQQALRSRPWAVRGAAAGTHHQPVTRSCGRCRHTVTVMSTRGQAILPEVGHARRWTVCREIPLGRCQRNASGAAQAQSYQALLELIGGHRR